MSWGTIIYHLKQRAEGSIFFTFEYGHVIPIKVEDIITLVGENHLLIKASNQRRYIICLDKVVRVEFTEKEKEA